MRLPVVNLSRLSAGDPVRFGRRVVEATGGCPTVHPFERALTSYRFAFKTPLPPLIKGVRGDFLLTVNANW